MFQERWKLVSLCGHNVVVQRPSKSNLSSHSCNDPIELFYPCNNITQSSSVWLQLRTHFTTYLHKNSYRSSDVNLLHFCLVANRLHTLRPSAFKLTALWSVLQKQFLSYLSEKKWSRSIWKLVEYRWHLSTWLTQTANIWMARFPDIFLLYY